jgi:hypothetical protein
MQREKILTILLLSIIIVGVCIIGIDAVPLGSTYYILAKKIKNEWIIS